MRTLPIVIALAVALAGTAVGRDPAGEPELGAPPDGSEPNVPTHPDQARDRFQSETRPKSDDMLATAVAKSLADDPTVSGMRVEVSADSGVVTLTGEVSGAEERAAAGRAAERVAGVREVRNEITIAERTAPGTPPIPERPAP